MTSTTGDWTDKTDFFLSEFEDAVRTASIQGDMAISDLQDTHSNAFAFSNMEILDANLATLPQGHINALEYPQGSRYRTQFLRFTLTAHPRLTNPGVLAIDPSEFHGQQATTVIIRAMLGNGSLRNETTKITLESNPKLLIQFYEHKGT